MPGFPIPANEKARLRELQSLRFEEWGSSAALDDLCAVTARLLDTPIAGLTLVDRNEQLFAGKTGLGADRIPRAIAFCPHTIMAPAPFIIEDAANDPRFCQNPLVTERPHIRAYLGMPLETTHGLRVGALCAVDQKPRHFTDGDIQTLTKLAGIAVSMLKSHRAMVELDDQLTGAVALQEKMLPGKTRIEHIQAASPLDLASYYVARDGIGGDIWGIETTAPQRVCCTSPILRAMVLPLHSTRLGFIRSCTSRASARTSPHRCCGA